MIHRITYRHALAAGYTVLVAAAIFAAVHDAPARTAATVLAAQAEKGAW